jgi:hypothetical protein
MRKLIALLLAPAALAAAGCESIRTIEIPADKEINVPGAGIGVTNPLAPDEVFPVDFGEVLSQELSQSFSTEGVDGDAVESMILTSMTATVQDPNEAGNQVRDLGFLTSMDFLIGDGVADPILVAESADGAFDTDPAPVEYEWELTGAELAPLVQTSPNLVMDTDVDIERRPNFATTIVFEAVVTVIVDPLGAL